MGVPSMRLLAERVGYYGTLVAVGAVLVASLAGLAYLASVSL